MRVFFGLIILLVSLINGLTMPAMADEPDICKRLAEVYPHDPDSLFKRYKSAEKAWQRDKAKRCRQVFWWAIKVKPLRDFLSSSELTSFERALVDGKCNHAVAIVRPKFVEAHSDVPSIVESENDFELWKQTTVASHYPRLGLCLELNKISEARVELDKLGLKPGPVGHFTNTEGYMEGIVPRDPIRRRDSAVYAILVMQLRRRHPDLSLALLRLSVEGKELKLHADHELYLAFFLKSAGVEGQVVKNVLSRPVDPLKRDALKSLANKPSTYEVPLFMPYKL